MQTEIYTIDFSGNGLKKVDQSRFNDLSIGQTLEWRGNSHARYCIVGRLEPDEYRNHTLYLCYNLTNPDQNAHLHRIESYAIVHEDDPDLWHTQHHYLQPDVLSQGTVKEYLADHERQAKDKKAREDAIKAESDRLEKIGRELWPSLIGDCKAIIVANHRVDDSDPQTDYFASHTSKTVILAPSNHTRDLFSEMRKAAELLPETQHLGVGKGHFSPYVQIDEDFQDDICYHQGQHSPWHRDFDHDDLGNGLVFHSREEAETYIQEKGEPHPMKVGENEITFSWAINEDEIEHREKYSMGRGYYLAHPYYRGGWEVRKYSGSPRREHYIALALRYDHLTGSETEEEVKGVDQGGYRVKYDRDWTWIFFDSKPSEETREALKAKGGRWSRKRTGWYFRSHLEQDEIEGLLG